MKKTLSIMAEALVVLCMPLSIASCNKEDIPSIPDNDENKVPVSITVGQDLLTKASIDANKETAIGNLQIFVFRSGGDDDGMLDAYGMAQNKTSMELYCTTGEREIYAIANTNPLRGIRTKKELLDTATNLGYSVDNGFTMIGNVTETITTSSVINVNVGRIASRIGIQNIKTDFSGTPYAEMPFTIDCIYLVNACTSINFGLSQTPLAWANQMRYNKDMPDFTLAPNLSATLNNGETYEANQYFYAYPNLTETDSQAKLFCDRYTRLVVEATLGSKKCYYPINIREEGGLLNNKSYLIRTLTITRLGSTSPDAPITTSSTPNDVTVLQWTDSDSDMTI
ncbi:MAG: fimbrial protein [Bacteroidales bacterium]|nr:fimbrial protein [Bacteroidales bacterium]